jgi:hypothetical protein
MQAAVRTIFVGGLLCACHTSPMHTPDGGDDEHDAPGVAGLSVSFATQPAVPGPLQDGVTIEEVTFKMLSLSVTGDAAQVSTPNEIDLSWKAGVSPDSVVFASAPTGVYSKLSMRMDGQLLDNSYWINGHATVNGTVYPFHIYDRDFLEIYLYSDEMLAPGGSVTIPVAVELDKAVGAIDWTLIDLDNGVLTLDTFDSYMPTFRANVTQSFVIKNVN